MSQIGLILEGGGMRGLYTAGVLDAFLDHDVHIRDCFAVSAGACNAVSYLAGQRTRFYRATTRFMQDTRYISLSNLFKHGSVLGTDFLFEDVANYLEPMDYNGYQRGGGRLTAVVTNCETGRAEYHRIHDLWRQRDLIRASSSLPLVSPVVMYRDKPLLDGSVADAVPIRFAQYRGFSKNILILTREAGYRKKPTSLLPMLKLRYREYPSLIKTMQLRHIAYNRTMEYIEQLEEQGAVLVIRPKTPLALSRFERDPDRAAKAYNQGMRDAVQTLSALRTFLH